MLFAETCLLRLKEMWNQVVDQIDKTTDVGHNPRTMIMISKVCTIMAHAGNVHVNVDMLLSTPLARSLES